MISQGILNFKRNSYSDGGENEHQHLVYPWLGHTGVFHGVTPRGEPSFSPAWRS